MFKIVPRDETFFDQLEQLSQLSKSSVDTLNEFIRLFPSSDGLPERIGQNSDQAAKIVQQSLCRLDDAFITPLDREDIMLLITDLYDVIDQVADVSRRFGLYEIKQLPPDIKEQSKNLAAIVAILSEVIAQLRHQKKLKELSPALDEIVNLEKQASKNRDHFLAGLFKSSSDPLEVMKTKELHDMLESAIWDAESVARTLGRVLLKNG